MNVNVHIFDNLFSWQAYLDGHVFQTLHFPVYIFFGENFKILYSNFTFKEK